MRTPYSKENARFSNLAHTAARKQLYPRIFSTEQCNLQFEDTLLELNKRGEALDGKMAIDRIVKVKQNPSLKDAITFTIQERFRKPKYAHYKDITITEWNNKSNLPSELYKITANLFLYGYYNITTKLFVDAIVVNVPQMLMQICNGNLNFEIKANPRSTQSFITLTFKSLRESGCIIYQLDT